MNKKQNQQYSQHSDGCNRRNCYNNNPNCDYDCEYGEEFETATLDPQKKAYYGGANYYNTVDDNKNIRRKQSQK